MSSTLGTLGLVIVAAPVALILLFLVGTVVVLFSGKFFRSNSSWTLYTIKVGTRAVQTHRLGMHWLSPS